jgi:hypothetical protein
MKETGVWTVSFHCLERGSDEESPPRAQTFSSSQLQEDYGRETTENKKGNVFLRFYEG